MKRFTSLAALVLAASACTSTKEQAALDPAAPTEALPQPGLFSRPGPDEDITEYDTNGDQKPDVVKIWAGKAPADGSDSKGTLLRKEVDLNRDGKVDLWNFYAQDGQLGRQAYDLDFDGRVDVQVFYEKGVVVKKEVFHGFGERPDTFKFYEKGQLQRVERDRDTDGRIDVWEYWEGEQIDRIGEDLDGDGSVDKWVKPKQST